MKQNQKLLIGLGLGLFAFYLYNRSKQKASATPEDKTNSNTTLPNGGGVVAPTPMPNTNSNNAPIGMTLDKHISNQVQSLKNEDLILQWKHYNCRKKESLYGAHKKRYISPEDRERQRIFEISVNQEVTKRGINVKC